MKISFSELSSFLEDPEDWAQRRVASATGARMSYTHVTRMAIYRFHQRKSKPFAFDSLIRYLDSYHLVNSDRRALAELQLANYIEWFDLHKPIVLGVSSSVRVDLGSGFFSSGQVHRIDLDLNSGGYKTVLLGAQLSSKKDPRAAVIKMGYADLTKRDPTLVLPASQGLDGGGLSTLNLSPKLALSVLDDLRDAARIAAATIARAR